MEQLKNILSRKFIQFILIPKLANAARVQKFRGIALLSSMRKWYMSCLILLLSRTKTPKRWAEVMPMGFSPGVSISHVHKALKFSTVAGAASPKSPNTMRPAIKPSISTSRYTLWVTSSRFSIPLVSGVLYTLRLRVVRSL